VAERWREAEEIRTTSKDLIEIAGFAGPAPGGAIHRADRDRGGGVSSRVAPACGILRRATAHDGRIFMPRCRIPRFRAPRPDLV